MLIKYAKNIYKVLNLCSSYMRVYNLYSLIPEEVYFEDAPWH